MTTTQESDSFPSYTQQQVFSLSWLAGKAPTVTPPYTNGTLQVALDNLVSNIGSWKVVWGPVYYLNEGVAANTVFIAQERDGSGNLKPNYVIAIAGTNVASLLDQIEDLDVVPTDWPVQSGSAGQVTGGDLLGVSNILFQMTYNNQSISDYLGSIGGKSGVSLTFAGHSLGGALAPMLMLALMDKNSAKVDTTRTQLDLWWKVNLLATAGPSIGDANFGTYFTNLFRYANGTKAFIWNGNDVVPHAWDKSTMSELTGFYGITFSGLDCTAIQIGIAQGIANLYNYAIFQPTPTFTYPTQGYAPSPNWTNDSMFWAQLGYQHGNAYINAFGTTWFSLPNPCDNPPKSKAEDSPAV